MRFKIPFFAIVGVLFLSFTVEKLKDKTPIRLTGTWLLVSGTTITKGVSAAYPTGSRMIKIINGTHFAFLKHDLSSKKDSTNHFDGGGGSYTLKGNQYTEHLEYYADKNWENKTFVFTVRIKKDTLIQTGLEKVENTKINRIIIEKYIRLK